MNLDLRYVIIELISKMYEGNISLYEPLNIGEISNHDIPEELLNLLNRPMALKRL